MVSENILITSQLGIHLRPAGAMCNEAVKYKSDISFKYGEGKTATDITCNVNAAGLSAGTHSVDVSVSVPDGCSVSGSSSVKLTLSAKQQETTVDNSSSQTQQTTTR